MGRTLAIVSLTALMLVLPASVIQAGYRSWTFDEAAEPNNGADLNDDLMWQDAPNGAIDRIYFDAIIDKATSVPFVRVGGENVRNVGVTYFHAFLGYWRDCNGDDFIGDALTGAQAYLVDLHPEADDICGAGTPYRDGSVVIELLAIGPRANTEIGGAPHNQLRDAGVLNLRGSSHFVRDDFVTVWHDWGMPQDPPAPSRLLLPFPSGTLDDTNGHFRYVDNLLFGGLSGTGGSNCAIAPEGNSLCWIWPVAQDGSARQCGSDPGDPLAVLGAFDPANPACSPIANIPDPVTSTVRDRYNSSKDVNEYGSVAVKPYDWGVRGNGDEGDNKCELRGNPADWELNPDGSIRPTTDYTWRSAAAGCSGVPEDGEPVWSTAAYANLEFPYNAPGVVAVKAIAQSTFSFYLDSHFNPSETLGAADQELCVPVSQYLTGPADPGAPPGVWCTGSWQSDAFWIRDTQYPHARATPLRNTIATFYADVNFRSILGGPERYEVPAGLNDDPATALPSGVDNVRRYGDFECNDGSSTLWSCNPLEWIAAYGIDPEDPNAAEQIALVPIVGDGIDFRDVECFDNSVAGTSVTNEISEATGGVEGDDRLCASLSSA